jgi:hypothetical protein
VRGYCIDCKHVSVAGPMVHPPTTHATAQCRHPNVLATEPLVSPVTGRDSGTMCYLARRFSTCGPEGLLWEPRE